MVAAAPQLFVFAARDAPSCVILIRGPCFESTEMVLWNWETQQVKWCGVLQAGMLDMPLTGLSPDGNYLQYVYHQKGEDYFFAVCQPPSFAATQYRARGHSWTVPPYFATSNVLVHRDTHAPEHATLPYTQEALPRYESLVIAPRGSQTWRTPTGATMRCVGPVLYCDDTIICDCTPTDMCVND